MAIAVKDVINALKTARIEMLNATDIINQARYSEMFLVRVRIGNSFSLKERAPWDIQVSHGILSAEIPALTLAEARYKARQIIESEEWEYL